MRARIKYITLCFCCPLSAWAKPKQGLALRQANLNHPEEPKIGQELWRVCIFVEISGNSPVEMPYMCSLTFISQVIGFITAD